MSHSSDFFILSPCRNLVNNFFHFLLFTYFVSATCFILSYSFYSYYHFTVIILIKYKRNATIISVAEMSCDKSKKLKIHIKKVLTTNLIDDIMIWQSGETVVDL